MLDGIHMMNLQAALLQVDAVYETQGNPEDWLVCAGACCDDKTKQVNLYQKWKKSGGMDKVVEKESFVKHIVPPVLTLAVCMALFGAVSVWNLLESKKIDDINDWINDSQIQQQYQEADEVMKESECMLTEAPGGADEAESGNLSGSGCRYNRQNRGCQRKHHECGS